jgi:hypothetical protein
MRRPKHCVRQEGGWAAAVGGQPCIQGRSGLGCGHDC